MARHKTLLDQEREEIPPSPPRGESAPALPLDDAPAPKSTPIPYRRICDLYNEHLSDDPCCASIRDPSDLSPKRRTAIKKLWQRLLRTHKGDDAAALKAAAAYFQACRGFYQDDWTGKGHLAYFCRDEVMDRVRDGAVAKRAAKRGGNGTPETHSERGQRALEDTARELQEWMAEREARGLT